MTQNVRLGLFILATIAVLAIGVFLIGSKQSRWQKTYTVRAQFDNVGGLSDGAGVRVGGIRQGSVEHLQLPSDPKGKVTVVMTLGEETRNIVRQDSTATIKSEGLLGDKFIEISFGTSESAKLKGGEVLRSNPPVDISDIVAKTDGILDSAKQAVDHMSEAADNISQITGKVNAGKGTAGALLNDRTMYNEATASVTAMHENLEALKHNFLLRGFFNKRGYVDASELQKHEISSVPSGQPLRTFSFPPQKLFGKVDSAKLDDKKALNEVGKYLQTAKYGIVVIEAAAGQTGESDKMLLLTQAQSTVVRTYLVQNFPLDDKRIKTRGLGKSDDGPSLQVRVYPPG